jgi:hypothetical protein
MDAIPTRGVCSRCWPEFSRHTISRMQRVRSQSLRISLTDTNVNLIPARCVSSSPRESKLEPHHRLPRGRCALPERNPLEMLPGQAMAEVLGLFHIRLPALYTFPLSDARHLSRSHIALTDRLLWEPTKNCYSAFRVPDNSIKPGNRQPCIHVDRC